MEYFVLLTTFRIYCLPKFRPYFEKHLKPFFSISKIPSPTTKSFKSKKPSLERNSFATFGKNTVDAIDRCDMSLD
jgi:hypothetical protein